MIHEFFEWCVWVLEVIGHQTGWGYELANIIIFVLLQPGLILLFAALWWVERRRRLRLARVNNAHLLLELGLFGEQVEGALAPAWRCGPVCACPGQWRRRHESLGSRIAADRRVR